MGDCLPWPLRHVVDHRGRDSGWVALRGALHTAGERAAFDGLASDHRLIGLTSYGPFPLMPPPFAGRSDHDYLARCEGWAHCFRQPDSYLPRDRPRVFLAESDFTDPRLVASLGRGVRQQPGPPRWDFVYVCLPGRWSEMTKDWEMASRCLPELRRMGLRGLLVGRADDDATIGRCGMVACGPLPWARLHDEIRRSRFLLVTSRLDASPRIVAEALCLDVPVVMNRHILGGWHYITPFTGAFFDDDRDVAGAAAAVLSRRHRPARWYGAHHGPFRAGRRLAALVRAVDPAAALPDYLTLRPNLVDAASPGAGP